MRRLYYDIEDFVFIKIIGGTMIYLDNAATTKPTSKVTDDMELCMKMYMCWGNPSSAHGLGHKARMIIEESRERIAKTINAEPEEIIFTSGGTEANNLAIQGILSQHKNINHFIISAIEHPSIKELAGKNNVYHILPVDGGGMVSQLSLLNAITNKGFSYPLTSVMMTNNEIGTTQDIKTLASIVHYYDGIFHTDAVQAYGHIPIDVKELGIDLMSVSAHKWNGPKGVGFLYKKKDLEINPLLYGGHQENGMRAGTENVPAIYAMAKQAELIYENKLWNNHARLKSFLTIALKNTIRDVKINSAPDAFSQPNIISITIPGVNAQQLIALLSLKEIYVSAGSACSSGDENPSHVLKAIGLSDDEANSTIRVSLGYFTTQGDLQIFVKELKNCVDILKME